MKKMLRRSLTVKLLTMQDKDLIFNSAKYLKKCNAESRYEDNILFYT